MITRKQRNKFLRALRRSNGHVMYGTVPEWCARTGAYIRCRVLIQAGSHVLMFGPEDARAMAVALTGKLPEPLSADLIEMAEIAEAMDAQRPRIEDAAAQWDAPSQGVH